MTRNVRLVVPSYEGTRGRVLLFNRFIVLSQDFQRGTAETLATAADFAGHGVRIQQGMAPLIG